MRFDRDDTSLLADWWFTVDRLLLTAVFALIGVGIIVSLAASPSVALSKDLTAFYFVQRHVITKAVRSCWTAFFVMLVARLDCFTPALEGTSHA